MTESCVHSLALVETDLLGERTRVWAGAHIMAGARIGSDCNVGDQVFVEGRVAVGDRVTIKNGAMLFDGVRVENDVFIGPGVVFTNDRFPRSPRAAEAAHRYADERWCEGAVVERGASIGARAVICPGVRVGRFSTIGAGAIVTRDVEPHALVLGTPARRIGWVCVCGLRVGDVGEATSGECGHDKR